MSKELKLQWDTPEKAYKYFEDRWDAAIIDDEYIRELVRLLNFLFEGGEK